MQPAFHADMHESLRTRMYPVLSSGQLAALELRHV